jgi:hypothetical protein
VSPFCVRGRKAAVSGDDGGDSMVPKRGFTGRNEEIIITVKSERRPRGMYEVVDTTFYARDLFRDE